jgi:hypothetical protein
MVDLMISQKVIDVIMQLLIAIGFPLGIYGLYCFFAAMWHRKPSHPYWQGIYAPASEFTEVGAKYRRRYFRCLKAFFAITLTPIIIIIAYRILKIAYRLVFG